MIHAHLPLFGGQPRYDGDLVIPGVAGSGAPVQVEFLDPDGSRTGLLLPTRNAADMLDVPVGGAVRASLVDSSSPCVFVAAEALGLSGTELPADLDADRELCARLEAIRTAAGVAMGFGTDAAVVSAVSPASPKVAIVSPVGAAMTLDGKTLEPTTYDLSVRMISMGKAHRVIPLTGALCVAVAAGIPGTVVHEMLAERRHDSDLRIGTASGVVPVNASFVRDAEGFRTERAVVYRTARRLMEGRVLVPTMIAGEQN
jgi:2-methylaconitate cis-trans-isomerase PrpF